MYSIKLDENNYFTGSYAIVGSVEGGVSVDTLPPDMSKATCYKRDFVSKIETDEFGVTHQTLTLDWIFDEEKFNKEEKLRKSNEIRSKRDEVFKIIDKYQLVLYYQELTETQKEELAVYRKAWLDAPETLIIPNELTWLI